MLIFVLIVFWIIHSGIIYVFFMIIKYTTDTGPVIYLNDIVITRDIWDELRGYRAFLKKVEAPKAKTFIKIGDITYLSSDRFAQLVAFNYVSNRSAKEAYKIIKKSNID